MPSASRRSIMVTVSVPSAARRRFSSDTRCGMSPAVLERIRRLDALGEGHRVFDREPAAPGLAQQMDRSQAEARADLVEFAGIAFDGPQGAVGRPVGAADAELVPGHHAIALVGQVAVAVPHVVAGDAGTAVGQEQHARRRCRSCRSGPRRPRRECGASRRAGGPAPAGSRSWRRLPLARRREPITPPAHCAASPRWPARPPRARRRHRCRPPRSPGRRPGSPGRRPGSAEAGCLPSSACR